MIFAILNRWKREFAAANGKQTMKEESEDGMGSKFN